MSFLADRVVETTTTSGTGTVTLAGAVPDHVAFADAFNNNDPVFYVISQEGVGWEAGLGTLTVGPPNLLARTTVLSSSNAGLKVNFAAGGSTKNVFCAPPAALFKPMVLDPSGTVRFDFDQGDDIASAATTDIGAATANAIDITGNAAITALGTAKAGAERWTRTTGTPTFTQDPVSLILPGGADIVAAAGDTQGWLSLGGGDWLCLFYQRASGRALVETPNVVKQMVGSATIAGSTTTSTGFVDVTGASQSITLASASNKVKVELTWQGTISTVTAANANGLCQVLRGATVISAVNGLVIGSPTGSGTSGDKSPMAFTFLDSPGSAGVVTYKLQHRTENASASMSSEHIQITLTEIAG